MKNRFLDVILKKIGYVRKDVAVKKIREQKSSLVELEEEIFELRCQRQQLLMEVEQRRKENELLTKALKNKEIENLASEKSLLLAKEVMKNQKIFKKVFGGRD